MVVMFATPYGVAKDSGIEVFAATAGLAPACFPYGSSPAPMVFRPGFA